MLKNILILLLILSIINMQLLFRFDFRIDVYKRNCEISVKLFGLRIFHAFVFHEKTDRSLGKLMLHIGKIKKELRLIDDGLPDGDAISVITLKNLMWGLSINEIWVKTIIGHKNAFATSILIETARILYCSVLSFLKSRQELVVNEEFCAVYNREEFVVDIYGILNISIANIIFIAIGDIIRFGYHAKQKKQQAREEKQSI